MFRGVYHQGKAKHVPDLDFVLSRAKSVNMRKIIVTTTCKKEFTQSEKLTIVHRTEADKIVAVGECGLDYDRTRFCDKATQLKHFEKHFQLSQISGLPLFLHDRNTDGEMAEIVRENKSKFSNAVVHSFTGSMAELQTYLNIGNVYIGVNGCSLKTEENINVVRNIPLDRLMLETDAPWCGIRQSHASFKHVRTIFQEARPEQHSTEKCVKGRSEPCHIIQVAEVLAAIMTETVENIAQKAYENTNNVFFS